MRATSHKTCPRERLYDIFNSGTIGPASFPVAAVPLYLTSRPFPPIFRGPRLLMTLSANQRSPPSARVRDGTDIVSCFIYLHRDVTRDRLDTGRTRIYEVRHEKKTLAPFGQPRESVGRYLDKVTRIDRLTVLSKHCKRKRDKSYLQDVRGSKRYIKPDRAMCSK